MDIKYLLKKLSFLLLLLFLTNFLFAQNTVVSGVVTDANTKKVLSYVTVQFAGSSIGMPTGNRGQYSISTNNTNYDHIKASFVGYKDATLAITVG